MPNLTIEQVEIGKRFLYVPWTRNPPLTNMKDTDFTNLRGWCLAGGLTRKWVEEASDEQLLKAYSIPAYYETISRLRPEDVRTGPRGRQRKTRGSGVMVDVDSFDFDDVAASAPPARSMPDVFSPPKAEPASNLPASISSDQFAAFVEGFSAAAEDIIARRFSQTNAKIEQRIASELSTRLPEALDAKFADTAAKVQLADKVKQQIRDLASEAARDVLASALPTRVEVSAPTMAVPLNLGLQHERFPTLMRLLNARGRGGFRLNIWLTGPTGSGKTTAVENATMALAEAGQFTQYVRVTENGKPDTWKIRNEDGSAADLNGLVYDSPFGGDSSLDADYKVVGYDKADGSFRWTTFLRIFCFGGVYIADEIDNWNPSALVALNAPLANGWVSTPSGIMRRHPDCCVIAAANTWGLGATSDYVGRSKLDAATVNRFPTKLDWPYDERLESALAESDGGLIGRKWCQVVQSARAEAKKQGLQVIFSPRQTYDGVALLKAGLSSREVIDMTLVAGLEPEYVKV
jgi:hypothetical protein